MRLQLILRCDLRQGRGSKAQHARVESFQLFDLIVGVRLQLIPRCDLRQGKGAQHNAFMPAYQ